MVRKLLFILLLLVSEISSAQISINGTLLNSDSLKPIENASVYEKAFPDKLVTTSSKGEFSLSVSKLPVVLVFSHVNFDKREVDFGKSDMTFYLNKKTKNEGGVTIRASRYKEKIKESPLTIESMGVEAIKETPASDFYEGLGHLKGVDVTAASLGFRIINTRGFNSTSPVRSLQLIDGVDNQAPGLNFSLGNFLGASEIDVQNSEIIVGAAGAFYGPNAFNGVISMTTKDPFKYNGLTAQVKVGERQLGQFALRYAKTYKNKLGVDKFAWKVNLFYLRAYDWEATNANPSTESKVGKSNWGGYDAVNRYGDENIGTSTNDASSKNQIVQNPGLGIYHRQGYWEKDIVNYNCRNFKSNIAMGYRFGKSGEIQYAMNFGTGTTVYQGDNRYSLNDILFLQNRLEVKFKDAFIRIYSTNEDAGNTYDAVNTSFILQKQAKKDEDWSSDYYNNWFNIYSFKVKALPGYPQNPFAPDYFTKAQEVMNKYSDSIVKWHSQNRAKADKYYDYQGNPRIYTTEDRFEPGTDRFKQLKKEITRRKSYGEGGSGFFDKSGLYHAQAEKRWHLSHEYLLTTGANGRLYRPNSAGTIFQDTNGRIIKNAEFGFYTGLEKKFIQKRLKANATLRIDKNQNFNFLFSPAASLVYSKSRKHVYRLSFTSAIRNPTLQDQYLYYNVGRAILLGNLTGFKNVLTVENTLEFVAAQTLKTLKYFNIKPVRPERVKSLELGYKGFLLKDRLTVDASCYYSMYKDFIGYKVIVDAIIDTVFKRVSSAQVYRVAANTEDKVTTIGFSAGVNYFFKKDFMLSGNYSYNELDRKGSTDPVIPAFNTPKHKFNIGISANDLNRNIFWLEKINSNWGIVKLQHFGFSINYKWVQGYLFEGSPQFTGYVPTYDLLDAQISKKVVKWKSTFKIGASNLLNKMQYQVYGGPQIGRMAYISFLYEPE